MKATPRQNAIAVVLMLGVVVALGARLWATKGIERARGPEYIAAGGERVYVQTPRKLFELTAGGELVRTIDIAALGMAGEASGMQALTDGRLLLGEFREGRVQRCDLSARRCEVLGPHETRAIGHGFKFYWDEAGARLYLTDGSRHRLLVQDGETGGVHELGEPGTLRFPNTVTVDAAGLVHVADTNHHRLVTFDVSGDALREVAAVSAEHPQGRPGHDWPVDFVLDDSGRWWVLNADGFLREPDLVGFDADGKPLRRVALPAGAEAFALAAAHGQLLVTDSERVRVYSVDADTGAVREFGDAAFAGALDRLRDERTRLQLVSGGAIWGLGFLLVAAVALAVSVMRAGRAGTLAAGTRATLPMAPVPANRFGDVRWLDPDPKVVKKLRRIAIFGLVATLLLPAPMLFLSLHDSATAGSPKGSLLGELKYTAIIYLYIVAMMAVAVSFLLRAFRNRIGVRGSLLCLADHNGAALLVPPEEVFYTDRAISYGPFTIPLKTGHGEPIFPPAAFERDIQPLLDRAQKVGAVNLQIYQLMQRQTMPLVVLALVVVGILLLFMPNLLPAF